MRVYTHTHTHVHVYMYACMHVCMYVYTHIYIYIYSGFHELPRCIFGDGHGIMLGKGSQKCSFRWLGYSDYTRALTSENFCAKKQNRVIAPRSDLTGLPGMPEPTSNPSFRRLQTERERERERGEREREKERERERIYMCVCIYIYIYILYVYY